MLGKKGTSSFCNINLMENRKFQINPKLLIQFVSYFTDTLVTSSLSLKHFFIESQVGKESCPELIEGSNTILRKWFFQRILCKIVGRLEWSSVFWHWLTAINIKHGNWLYVSLWHPSYIEKPNQLTKWKIYHLVRFPKIIVFRYILTVSSDNKIPK